MATANVLITRALRKANLLAAGQTADGNDAEDALATLNDMLDQWSLEDLMIYYSTVISHALTSGVGAYTIGATGDIVTTRPIEILNPAYLRTADNLDIPISVVSFEDYQKQIQKATTNTYPSMVAYQPNFPNGSLYLWQVPTSGLTLRLIVNTQFAAIAALATEVALPVGYNKCIVDNLAKELLIEYKKVVPVDLKEAANNAKMLIKRKNSKKTTMQLDSMFLPKATRVYNPYSDT